MKDFLTKEELEKRLDDADKKVAVVSTTRNSDGEDVDLHCHWTSIKPVIYRRKVTGYHVSINITVSSFHGDIDLGDTVYVSSRSPVKSLEKQIKVCNKVIEAQSFAEKVSIVGPEAYRLDYSGPVDINAYYLLKKRYLTTLKDEIESAAGILTKEELWEKTWNAHYGLYIKDVEVKGKMNFISTSYAGHIEAVSNGFNVSIKGMGDAYDKNAARVDDTFFVSSKNPAESLEKQVQVCNDVVVAQSLADKAAILGTEVESLACFPIDLDIYYQLKAELITDLIKEFEPAD